jgi:hypothetical protein
MMERKVILPKKTIRLGDISPMGDFFIQNRANQALFFCLLETKQVNGRLSAREVMSC